METNHHTAENFSLSEGGPFYTALVKMRLLNHPGKIIVAGLCITWLPLAIITAFEGTFWSGPTLPFLKDVAMQVRLLIALPLLIAGRLFIDKMVTVVIKYLSDTFMSSESRQQILDKILGRAKKLTNSALTELVLMLIVIATTIIVVKTGFVVALRSGSETWMAAGKNGNTSLTYAGDWAVFVSIPLFQFLLLRWLWRYIVWALLLFRISKLNLNLLPTHPDRAGGLGILIMAQRNFNLLFVAIGVILSGALIAQLSADPDSFNTVRNEAIGYIVLSLILILFPLLFFTGKLVKTKQEGLLKLSNLGVILSSKFENEWVNEMPVENSISEKEVDPSMVYDYSGIYDSLQKLRAVPVTIRDIIGLALILFIPFIPLLFIHFSVAELLQKILTLLA